MDDVSVALATALEFQMIRNNSEFSSSLHTQSEIRMMDIWRRLIVLTRRQSEQWNPTISEENATRMQLDSVKNTQVTLKIRTTTRES